jgi:nitroimidazol reductase NimA-like FMN-containing flavoprotein (pyridoxamine 5'-phosphate oxidase superfamily)
MPTVRSGPWSPDTIAEYLSATAIPIRLASVGKHFPLVQSLWFLYDDDSLWCCTQADSVLAKRLHRDNHVGFEISADAPPYRGVRGKGRVQFEEGAAPTVLPRLVEKYLGAEPTDFSTWLLSRMDNEVAIRITDLSVSSWDYSSRMPKRQ